MAKTITIAKTMTKWIHSHSRKMCTNSSTNFMKVP